MLRSTDINCQHNFVQIFGFFFNISKLDFYVHSFHFNTDRKICVFLFNVGGTTFLIDMPLDMDFKLPI